ncbi:MAG: ribonuclease D [Geminicoccaceae bacterium]|nr:ribonuclease D [Geminicoccaceae bacterium]
MTLIQDSPSVADVCNRLRKEPFVTVDTEFMRDRTYWPQLCLVQLGGEKEAVAIDPLVPGIDLSPLVDFLLDRTVIKVLHACRQDMEIFYHLCGRELPRPIFDSQVAAMVCGFGEEVGYETLVNKLAGARLDKTSRFTDWSKRPLSARQLAYALGDVTHLRLIFEKLAKRIERDGRAGWVEEELDAFLDPSLYELAPADAWKRLKFRSREPRFIGLVQAIAEWRERKAQTRNVPRNRILRDDLIMELAANRPKSAEQLRDLPRINLDRESVAEIVAAVEEVMARPADRLPSPPVSEPTPRGVGPLTDLLKVLLKLCAEESDVAQRLIATSSDLEALAQDDNADIGALKGWRREIFGNKALALKHGRLALAANGNRIRILELDDSNGS